MLILAFSRPRWEWINGGGVVGVWILLMAETEASSCLGPCLPACFIHARVDKKKGVRVSKHKHMSIGLSKVLVAVLTCECSVRRGVKGERDVLRFLLARLLDNAVRSWQQALAMDTPPFR